MDGRLCFFFVETVKTHKRERERKVKKLGDDGSLLTTMDMQSDGQNHIKKFRH